MVKETSYKAFDFKNVRLLPKECIVDSRSQVDVTTNLGNHTFKSAALPANMSTIIDENLAEWLATNGYFYVMHRFDIDPIAFTMKMQAKNLVASISLGIKEADYDYVTGFVARGITPDYITVDVAHGHSANVILMVKKLKEKLPGAYIIAGNVGTPEGALALEEAGADCIKGGIGPGCFVPGTQIRTKNGTKNIEDIVLGEEVLTHLATYEKVANKFEYNHHEEMITVNGIISTPQHEFYVCDKKNTELVNENNYKDFCYWVEAHELDETTQVLLNTDFKFVEIDKEEIHPYKGKTYDLEVENAHSYNANNVIVHNSACLTAPNTGFGTRDWQLSAINEIAKVLTKAQLIADGGVREYGDYAKAIAFGADMVMVGGMFAGHDENPGEIIEDEHGDKFKVFFGSASEHQKGEVKHVEGKKMLVPYKGSIADTFRTIEEHLQSSVSYAGGRRLLDLRDVEYIIL